VIALESVSARQPPARVDSLSLAWLAGVHALVGAGVDGGPLLLRILAGRVRPRTGRALIHGSPPTDRSARKSVAYVSLRHALPDALRVRETLALADRLRGEQPHAPDERLSVLGVESLAPRPVHTLSAEEVRAVAFAEALTSTAVRVILLEEPFLALDPRAGPKLREALRARAAAGCAVILSTASIRDAAELADDYVYMRGGVAFPNTAFDFGATSSQVRVIVLSSDPQAVLASLARESEVDALARKAGAVVARGKDPLGLAQAAGRAVIAAGAELIEIRLDRSP
jgi:ABC-type multidrug transport system ATPase subunit